MCVPFSEQLLLHMKALQWHPDKCNAPDAADQFRKVKEDPMPERMTEGGSLFCKAINFLRGAEAFQILSSKTTRREHDAKLDAGAFAPTRPLSSKWRSTLKVGT